MVLLNRIELVGRTKSKDAVLLKIAQKHSLNCTGRANFNKFGQQDGIGLQPVTEKFVDNFLLKVLIPDYNIKDGKPIFLGPLNTGIRALLNAHGLEKCNVKAVGLAKTDRPNSNMKDIMPNTDDTKEAECYYVQDFKVACPNVDYEAAMKFVRSNCYKVVGMVLKDIDITIDFAGSFEKLEIIDYLVQNCDFREQETENISPRTIVNNDKMVGRNCLTYMETIGNYRTRQKIYNKFVQALECQSVRSKIGCHWKDWVCQQGTRLSAARDKASARGLTRAEVTIYIDQGDIPSDFFIESTLKNITEYLPNNLIYSTPFSSAWRAYCDTFIHSLVCVDEGTNEGLIVYSYNEITGKISGQSIDNWKERSEWCLVKLTLNGNLPLDLIKIQYPTKNNKDILEVTGTRYYKVQQDRSSDFTTRLVSKKGCFSYNNASVDENTAMLIKAGFLPHPNCVPLLASTKASATSKTNAILEKTGDIVIKTEYRLSSRVSNTELKQRIIEEAAKIEQVRKPLMTRLARKKEELRAIEEYSSQFKNLTTVHLQYLEQGEYNVMAAMKTPGKYGDRYRLCIQLANDPNLHDGLYVVWSNYYIKNIFDGLTEADLEKLLDKDSRYLTLYNKPLGKLTILGQATNMYGKITVYCRFEVDLGDTECHISELKTSAKQEIQDFTEEITRSVTTCRNTMPIIPRESLLNYRDYKNLSDLPPKSVHMVTAVGRIMHYGKERLVVQIKDTIYQAGEDLDSKGEDLKLAEMWVRIEKIATNRTTRIKFAVCSVHDACDWSTLVDYSKTEMLKNLDGSTCIVDIKTVEVKGLKRKLLLSNDGHVYKLKRSKLEDDINTPGFY